MGEPNPETQKAMIREAMEVIAKRRPGRSRLVYDRATRTIVVVSQLGAKYPVHDLHIGLEDADMI